MTTENKNLLTADGAVAAELSDIATTLVSSEKAVVGWHGFVQKLGLVAIGFGIANYRLTGDVLGRVGKSPL